MVLRWPRVGSFRASVGEVEVFPPPFSIALETNALRLPFNHLQNPNHNLGKPYAFFFNPLLTAMPIGL